MINNEITLEIAKKYREFKNALYLNKGYDYCSLLEIQDLELLNEYMQRKLKEEKREPFTVEKQYLKIIDQVLKEKKDITSSKKVA